MADPGGRGQPWLWDADLGDFVTTHPQTGLRLSRRQYSAQVPRQSQVQRRPSQSGTTPYTQPRSPPQSGPPITPAAAAVAASADFQAGNYDTRTAGPSNSPNVDIPEPSAPRTGPVKLGYDDKTKVYSRFVQGKATVNEPSYLLGGSPAPEEALWPSYQIPKNPKQFFRKGKVFSVLWSEPMGEGTYVTSTLPAERYGASTGPFGEPIFSKVRRFVVVKEGGGYCTSIPINTYQGKGVAKPSVTKSEHSIIHSGRDCPPLGPGEGPSRGGDQMQPRPIRVDMDRNNERLDPMSRLNYGKVYTVEHNIKARSIGAVNRGSELALDEQFKNVIVNDISPQRSIASRPTGGSAWPNAPGSYQGNPAQGNPAQGNPAQGRPRALQSSAAQAPNDALQQYRIAAVTILRSRGVADATALAIIDTPFRYRLSQNTSQDQALDIMFGVAIEACGRVGLSPEEARAQLQYHVQRLRGM